MKQLGAIKGSGSFDNITFKLTKHGYIMGRKSKLDKHMIETDPRFKRTRENGVLFKRGAEGGKLFRESGNPLVKYAVDGNLVPRVVKLMMQIIKSDTTSTRADRNLAAGDARLMEGFDFNGNSPFAAVLGTNNTVTIDRTTGALEVIVPPFVPEKSIQKPTGATHYKIVAMGTEIDFATGSFTTGSVQQSTELPVDSEVPTVAVDLTTHVTAGSTKTILFLVGIQFFEEVNGVMYVLNNSKNNALKVVKVSAV